MIYLEKGQKLADNPAMVVYDPTGYYNDGDSVICASASTPDEPACRFEAKFIAYGGFVYSISDPDDLLEQIKKIDPKTLFGKDSQQVAVDKVVDQIVTQDTSDTNQATSTPESGLSGNNASTTPATTNTSTSTPQVGNTSTTTPNSSGSGTSSGNSSSGQTGTGSGDSGLVNPYTDTNSNASSTSSGSGSGDIFSTTTSTTSPSFDPTDTIGATTTSAATSTTSPSINPSDTVEATTTPPSNGVFSDLFSTTTPPVPETPTTTPPDVLLSDVLNVDVSSTTPVNPVSDPSVIDAAIASTTE